MEPDRARSAEERLRAEHRRQAIVIATLSEAVSHLHRGASALKAENAELRAESEDLRRRLLAAPRNGSREGDGLFELAIEAGPRAPAIARRAVAAGARRAGRRAHARGRAAAHLRAGHQQRAPQRGAGR